MTALNLFPQTEPAATFSPDRVYRYTLQRRWSPGPRRIVWLLLNPSTADETQDDPTIRRCIAFSKAWGYDALTILNAYALRSTDPKGLWLVADPVGPENDQAIEAACHGAERIVCGWGAHLRFERRIVLAALLERIEDQAGPWTYCLRMNADGSPGHPLYLPGTLTPQPYEVRR